MGKTILGIVCSIAFVTTFILCYTKFFKDVAETLIGKIIACILMSVVISIIVLFITMAILTGAGIGN